MPTSPPDRALRRLVVDLAALHVDDLAVVLEALSGEQRRQVDQLLQEFAGFGFHAEMSVATAPAGDLSRLSPWLADRVDGRGASHIAPYARQALQDAVARLFPRQRATTRRKRLKLFAERSA